MWPRGRLPSSQNRGSSKTVNYPLTLGFNQYPQSQQAQQFSLISRRGGYMAQGSLMGQPGGLMGQQGGFSNQGQNFNNKPNRRERLRGRQQRYSFYSDDSNSNYSSNTAGSVRGHNSARGGIVNAAMKNLPQKPPPPNNRRGNDRDRDQVPSTSDNRKSERNNPQNKENRSQSRARQDSEVESHHRMYFCPKCGENYAYRHTHNKYMGKIPLILHCNHTMCQECVYQNLKNYKVNCPTCQTDSILTQEETPVCQSDMQNVFLPNFYVIGVICYYKPQGGYLGNLENMRFVSTTNKKQPSPSINPSDTCCFVTCTKQATMYCPSCEGIYCVDCCTVLHKSTKKLMTHEPVPRRKEKFSLMLENCEEHPQMQVEFFCKTCDLTSCCYCVLDKHTDHERVPLYHLNETEMEEFKRLKKVAERALREVLHAQKKTARLVNFNVGSVRKDACQYFADFHAKIETVEKKICDELENFKSNNRGLDGIQSSLTGSAETLKQLVAFNENKIGDKKLNLRGALEKLRNIENIPRFLLNEDGNSEPVRFVVNTTAEELEEHFMLEKCEDSEYRLVNEKELPENYVIDIDDSDSEVEGNISVIISQSNRTEDVTDALAKLNDGLKMVSVSAANSVSSRKVQKHTKPIEPKKKKMDMERVDVQHINSMDSFFVQHKNNQSKLASLTKDIENYVKMGGAQPVEQPQLNDLYLALYITESQNQKEQRWCRARLTEIKNGENGPIYEMFFIDYGKTQTVDCSRIKDIPAFIAQKKPFAIECMLYNPMSVNWNNKAHYSLAKILNGKDVHMMVKAVNAGIHEVDLMIASSDGGVTSVTDILVHAHNSVAPFNEDNASMDDSVVSLRREGFYPTLRVFPNSKKFVKNQKERVTIANVVDPHNIFVHLVQYQDAFKNMCHAIKKAYRGAKANRCIPIEGTYVLVEYRDSIRSNWHRAFIKSVDLNSDKVQVLLVDWGINVVVPTSSVKPLKECFTRLESQAVLVRMAHVSPYNAQATWSPHSSYFLLNFHQGQDVLKMVVQDVENGVQVALFDTTSNVDLCLNTMMVENNLADSTGAISTKLEWPRYELQNPEFSEDEGLMATLLKKVDEQANEESDEEDVSDVKKRQVDVVKVEAPDLIWVKFLEFKARESEMFKELQIHYSEVRETRNKWKNGDQCVVEVEHEYVRGKILEEINGNYKVYLYDKVKEVTVSIDRIYIYNKYFMKYPQAVIKSHLAYIKPAGGTGKWSNSSIEALQDIFDKRKRIYASKAPEADTELSQKSLPLYMWYGLIIQGGPLDPDRLKYVSINNFLVKLGFAYKLPRPITPKPSTSKMSLQDSVSTSPVNTARSGEELLKILTGNVDKTSDQEPPSDEKKEESTVKKRSEKTQCMKILESLNKPAMLPEKEDILKSGEPLKSDVTNCNMKEDSEFKKTYEQPSGSKKTESTEKPDGKDEEETINNEIGERSKNWNAIVDEELGEPATKPKTLQNAQEDDKGESGEGEGSPYHKSEVVIDDWLPPFRLTKRDFQARVTCVETRGHLYIHDQAMDEVYNKMESNIKEYFDTNPPEICDHRWEPGQLCTIKFNDGKWYRGKILKIKNPKEISVFMIDFGSDHDLTPDVLFREVLYTDIGAFATKVKLEKVYTKSGSWLSSDYDHFHEMVTDWCRIVVKGPLHVELPLVEVYNENGVCVNHKLVEVCPNLSRCSNFPIQQGVDEDDTVVIESIENEELFADEMLVDSFEQELEKRKDISNTETSPAETTRSNLEYKRRPIPDELLTAKQVLLEIGGILNYDKVALKTPGEEVTEEMYNLVIDIQDAVDSLPVLKDIEVGMPCLAPFSEDGVWYRAKVACKDAVDLGFVDVIFVDYGNSESVSIKDVRQIDPKYLEVPQQTWVAGLNIVLNDGSDVITVLQVLNSLERKKSLIQVVKEEPLTVEIYNKDGQLAYQTLIDSGSIKKLYQEDNI